MVGQRHEKILECNGQEPNAMVKGAVILVKATPITTVHNKKKRHKKGCTKSCSSYVHAICKDKKFSRAQKM
jgi:hypothetical protein